MVVQPLLFQTFDWFWRFLVSNLRQSLQYIPSPSTLKTHECSASHLPSYPVLCLALSAYLPLLVMRSLLLPRASLLPRSSRSSLEPRPSLVPQSSITRLGGGTLGTGDVEKNVVIFWLLSLRHFILAQLYTWQRRGQLFACGCVYRTTYTAALHAYSTRTRSDLHAVLAEGKKMEIK